jgi:hypothetical protein
MLSWANNMLWGANSMPVADDTEQRQKRPNGAGQRVYRVPEKEGHPNDGRSYAWCCIESDAINSWAKARRNPGASSASFLMHSEALLMLKNPELL